MTSNPKATSSIRIALFLVVFTSLVIAKPVLAGTAPQPQDVITIGTASGVSGSSVDVPVFIQDVSGTPLGIDQPAGSRIQAFSIKVNYGPAADVQSVTFSRAGITASLTPADELNSSSTGSISLLDDFDESTNLIPFVSNAAAPGQEVAHLVFQLAPSLQPGTQILLTLDPALTQLTDQGGDAATKESDGGGNLAFVAGAITVGVPTPTLSIVGMMLLVLLLGVVGVRFAARSL